MKSGRLNILLGAIGIIVSSIGGIVLAATIHKNTTTLEMIKTLKISAHVHGELFAFYNIIFGLAVVRLSISDMIKSIGAVATILAYLLPVGLLLRVLAGNPKAFEPLLAFGGISFIVSAVIIAIGYIKKQSE